MPAIYVARISQWIEKRFSAKGGNVITDIDQSAVVQLPWESGVEDLYLKGWNRYIASFAVTAVAAQFSRALLRNPTGSNVIAVVESLWLNPSTAVDYTLENSQPDLATVQAPGTQLRRLDARSGFTDATCVVSSDNNATQFPGSANVIMRRGINSFPEVFVNATQQWTLLPKDGLWIVSDVVNTNLQANVQWRERALEQSELT